MPGRNKDIPFGEPEKVYDQHVFNDELSKRLVPEIRYAISKGSASASPLAMKVDNEALAVKLMAILSLMIDKGITTEREYASRVEELLRIRIENPRFR